MSEDLFLRINQELPLPCKTKDILIKIFTIRIQRVDSATEVDIKKSMADLMDKFVSCLKKDLKWMESSNDQEDVERIFEKFWVDFNKWQSE